MAKNLSEHGYVNTWAYSEQYVSTGVKQWHQHYGVSGSHRYYGMQGLALSSGNVYGAGWASLSGSDVQLSVWKHQVDGAFVWKHAWGDGTIKEIGYDVAESGGDIYLAGRSGDSGDPDGVDLVLAKLHDDGASVSLVDSTVFADPGDDVGRGIALAD